MTADSLIKARLISEVRGGENATIINWIKQTGDFKQKPPLKVAMSDTDEDPNAPMKNPSVNMPKSLKTALSPIKTPALSHNSMKFGIKIK